MPTTFQRLVFIFHHDTRTFYTQPLRKREEPQQNSFSVRRHASALYFMTSFCKSTKATATTNISQVYLRDTVEHFWDLTFKK